MTDVIESANVRMREFGNSFDFALQALLESIVRGRARQTEP
jgi:hypothetical protein